jgi:hypothetical protein
MRKFIGLKTGLKLILFFGVLALVITSVFLANIRGEQGNSLTEAIEGGESVLTAIGRSHESLTNFVKDKEEMAADLLTHAKASQEYAEVRLTSSKNSKDTFLLNMIENYWMLLNSSHVMTQGVDNLLTISDDSKETLNYYREGAYEEAAEKASVCLQTLTPLVEQFEPWNHTLDGVDYSYLVSGQKDRVKNAIGQYKDEMRIYLAYISLLESIEKGVDYLNVMDNVNNLFDQLQHAIANQDYASVPELLQQISNQLQLLKGPNHQNAASIASKIDPSLLDGSAFNTAQDLKNLLKDLEGIQGFENYLGSVAKYAEALNYVDQGDLQAAEEAIEQGTSLLGQGQTLSDLYVQKYYTALENAFNTLKMRIRGPQPEG